MHKLLTVAFEKLSKGEGAAQLKFVEPHVSGSLTTARLRLLCWNLPCGSQHHDFHKTQESYTNTCFLYYVDTEPHADILYI